MNVAVPPSTTYRLQFNRDFKFVDAIAIIPYLHRLGVSHVYDSPFLKAHSGSPHGYDIVDHNALNPEIGGESDFTAYVATLRRHGMGHILDIVPNHMGIGSDNSWWLDVLESGESSIYAGYFDIDWHPVHQVLHNKILVPFLGDHYGIALERGDLQLDFELDTGRFVVRYHEHLFPIDPRTYSAILSFRSDTLVQILGPTHDAYLALTALIVECKSLPRRTDLSAAHRRQRRHGISACKRALVELCRTHPEIEIFIRENAVHYSGTPGRPKSFDRLHRLLEAQAYRLAYWRVASDEINYRRFFDINQLAALRMEDSEVFVATHRLIRNLLSRGQVDGLRIDHLDGLSDPYRYCCELQTLIRNTRDESTNNHTNVFYLLVEKILASHERLPADWPVTATTGYEVAFMLNSVFVHPDAKIRFKQIYSQFIGHSMDFDDLVYERKTLIIRRVLSSELTVLANLLSSVAQADRRTRDFTYHSLRDALSEIVACFPVYRTYITATRISDEDRRYMQWAVSRAKKRNPATDGMVFDFIHEILTLARLADYGSESRRRIVHFTLRFQQYTAPVMAKGVEDTAFYIYHCLVSLNDVGFDPRTFGIPLAAFHEENKRRLASRPHGMVTTSTHDSKRGEDVRARINVLSEIANEWRLHVGRWSRINHRQKPLVDGERAPAHNDEYLLYQILVGAWPLEPLDAAALHAFRERIDAYMLKAIREAKVHTSWSSPNEPYEAAMHEFVHRLLENPDCDEFLADFIPFQKRIARFGLLNSLSQTLLKLTIPGVPDIYQGNEMWAFNLVDPDNRRPVDFVHRGAVLQSLVERCQASEDWTSLARELIEQLEDGRAKLYLTWKIACLRRECPRLFSEGEYLDLETRGPRAEHLCAFARRLGNSEVIIVAARWFACLNPGESNLPLDEAVWRDTWVEAPNSDAAKHYRNVFTNERIDARSYDERSFFNTAALLSNFPVALLI